MNQPLSQYHENDEIHTHLTHFSFNERINPSVQNATGSPNNFSYSPTGGGDIELLAMENDEEQKLDNNQE